MKVKNLDQNVNDTFKKMLNFRKEKISFGKVNLLKLIFIFIVLQLNYLNEEEKERQKTFLKENPKKKPNMATYWKTKPIGKDFRKESKRKKIETEVNDNGVKVHIFKDLLLIKLYRDQCLLIFSKLFSFEIDVVN